MPNTRQPAAAQICTVSCPTSPSPSTTTVSPRLQHRLAHAVQRDRADRDESGVSEADRLGDRHDQIARHEYDFGMIGEVQSRAGDALARLQIGDAGADRLDDAGAGIAERHRRAHEVAHDLRRLDQSLLPGPVENLADEIGTRARLLQRVHLGEFDDRLFGAGADQRGDVANDHATRPQRRRRDIGQLHLSGLEVLQDGLHEPWSPSVPDWYMVAARPVNARTWPGNSPGRPCRPPGITSSHRVGFGLTS